MSTTRIHGFSLLEVLITAAIIGVISTLVVVKYSGFNSAVLLKNQAYEIALDVRETQVYAVSVRGQGTEFREDYGLFFDIATQNTYLQFYNVDSAGEPVDNPRYDAGSDTIVGNLRTIDSRFFLSEICVVSDTNGTECDADDISISFRRPDFDARFHATGISANDQDISSVSVTIEDNTGAQQIITITSTGLISVASN